MAEVLDVDWIDTTELQGKLLARILTEFSEGLWDNNKQIDCILESEDEKNAAYAMLSMEPDFEEPIKIANACLKRIVIKYVQKEMQTIQSQIANLPMPSPEFPELQKQLIEYRKLKENVPTIAIQN